MSNKVTLPLRKVHKTLEGDYIVLEKNSGGWFNASKRYVHSTSAFAALGRLTQTSTSKALGLSKATN